MKILINAPAKINLFLEILEKLPNGYHNVEMIMQSVSLYDKIFIRITNQTEKIEIKSNFDFNHSIENNTAFKAAKAFFEFTKIKNPGIEIYIEKKIPICAGLAGGSTDAAAVLLGLIKLFKINISKGILAKIGAKIGADIPFCFFGGTMLAQGIGTKLTKIKDMPFGYIVLTTPQILVSTQKAYHDSDSILQFEKRNSKLLLKAIETENINNFKNMLFNRFEDVLKLEEINAIKQIFYKHNTIAASLSGSGPSVFGIFEEKIYAQKAFEELKQTYKNTFLIRPISCGVKES